MENQKEVKDYINKIVKPIFDKVLKETNKNPMSVGVVGKKEKKYCFYNPHNYRLYSDFDKTNLNIKELNKLPKPTTKRSVVPTYRLKNSREHEINNFMGCRITIKKTQVEIQNKVNIKKVYRIEIVADSKNQFYDIIKEKNDECFKVLEKFIKIYGGKSNLSILKVWCENKLWKEDAIDLIPIKARWHTPISKKVYNEQNIEFPDPVFASNYVDTRAIESIAPNINNVLKGQNILLKESIKVQKNTAEQINYLAKNLNIHIPAIKQIGTSAYDLSKQVNNFNIGTNKLIKSVDRLTNTLTKEKIKPKQKEPLKKKKYGLSNEEIKKIRRMKI